MRFLSNFLVKSNLKASKAHTSEEPTFCDETFLVRLTDFFKVVLLAFSLCVPALLRNHAFVSHQLDLTSDLEVDHLEFLVCEMSPLLIESYELKFVVLGAFVERATNYLAQAFAWYEDSTVLLVSCV